MPTKELTTRDLKLVQYLTEAYGKERQLETALQAHIAMTTRAAYKKRLQQHLTETRSTHAEVERRIKKLGSAVPDVAIEATTTAPASSARRRRSSRARSTRCAARARRRSS